LIGLTHCPHLPDRKGISTALTYDEDLCQSLVKSAQILLVMSDRTDTFHELESKSGCSVTDIYLGRGTQKMDWDMML
jgi:hypothetical protein